MVGRAQQKGKVAIWTQPTHLVHSNARQLRPQRVLRRGRRGCATTAQVREGALDLGWLRRCRPSAYRLLLIGSIVKAPRQSIKPTHSTNCNSFPPPKLAPALRPRPSFICANSQTTHVGRRRTSIAAPGPQRTHLARQVRKQGVQPRVLLGHVWARHRLRLDGPRRGRRLLGRVSVRACLCICW
jgi:hypothetical protein